MKYILFFICVLVTNTMMYSQSFEKNYKELFSFKLDTIIGLESNLVSENILSKNDDFFSMDSKPKLNDFNYNTEELSKKVFINFNFVENTYIDYSDYLRGCGPLDDGITNTVNSGELMLSNIIDNFVNNYLLKSLIFKN